MTHSDTETTALPEPLDPDFQLLVDQIAALEAGGVRPWHEITVPELRAATKDIRKGAAPVAGVSARDLQINADWGEMPARLYVPLAAAETGPGLVYFHGGGFTIGSIETHDSIVAQLAALSGVKILSVEYRLGPENPFPAAHDDALFSCRWAFKNAAAIGFDPDRIAVGGDSAGANLAASACIALRDDPEAAVRYMFLLYPNTTIEGSQGSRATYAKGYYLTLAGAHYLFSQYLPQAAMRRDPRIDLLRCEDVSGLPSTFLAIGHCDILYDECIRFADNMSAAGVAVELRTYPGFIHGFFGFAHLAPAVLTAFEEAAGSLAAGLRR